METTTQTNLSIESIGIKYDTGLNIDPPMQLNQLSILVGANGIGKTFVMIHNYVLSAIMFNYIQVGLGKSQSFQPVAQMCQYMFDASFDDVDWSGTCVANFSNGNKLEVTFDKGKVAEAHIDIKELKASPPMYLSKNTRQFDYIHAYMRFRKLYNGTEKQLGSFAVAELLKDYKLYDLSFMESLINKCPITEIEDFAEHFDGFQHSPMRVEVDLEACKFNAILHDGSERVITRYSAGEQAILVMFLGIK